MLIRVIKYLAREIRMRRNPLGYARRLGVEAGDGCVFYAMSRDMFGSDPYLIKIGKRVHVTNGVKFVTHDGGTLIFRNEYPDLDVSAPISVGNDVYIGTFSLIMPGVKIGNKCVIGAGSIVTRDIPDGSLAVGVPARVIKTIDEYLVTLKEKSLGCGALSAKKKEIFLRNYFRADR